MTSQINHRGKLIRKDSWFANTQDQKSHGIAIVAKNSLQLTNCLKITPGQCTVELFSSWYTISWVYIFAFCRDALKFWNRNILSFFVCHPYYQSSLHHIPLLVNKLLIYCKKILIKQNKNYKSIYKSILLNNTIGFDWSRLLRL